MTPASSRTRINANAGFSSPCGRACQPARQWVQKHDTGATAPHLFINHGCNGVLERLQVSERFATLAWQTADERGDAAHSVVAGLAQLPTAPFRQYFVQHVAQTVQALQAGGRQCRGHTTGRR